MKQIAIGESVQGANHKGTDIECQDSYKKFLCEDGTIILAVADGHGSKACPFSKTGSRIAVNVFCKVMKEFHNSCADNQELLVTRLNREGDTKVAQTIDSQWKLRVLKAHKDNKRIMPCTVSGKMDEADIYRQYGTTLLGLMLASSYYFAFQLGDGDICYVDNNGLDMVLQPEKILGVETHSLSRIDAWKKAITTIRRKDFHFSLPSLFMLSTDGFANSYENDQKYWNTCIDYFETIKRYGSKTVNENLKNWLTEISEIASGDDITLMLAYSYEETIDETVDTHGTDEVLESKVTMNGQC